MSFSTDAHLYFGFDFWDPEDGEGQEGPSGGEMWEEGDPAYHITEHLGGIPDHIEVATHCASNFPVWFVCIAGSHKTANRGFSTELSPGEMMEDPDWRDQLREFCEDVGLHWKEPSWRLASSCDDL